MVEPADVSFCGDTSLSGANRKIRSLGGLASADDAGGNLLEITGEGERYRQERRDQLPCLRSSSGMPQGRRIGTPLFLCLRLIADRPKHLCELGHIKQENLPNDHRQS